MSAVVLAVGLALVPAGRALGSVAVALGLDELVAASEHVVLAECVGERTRWDARGRIVTDATVRVVEAYKGELGAGAELVVRTLGGEIGGLGMVVPGAGRVPVGERAILFLERDAGAAHRPVGMSQGILPVRRGAGGLDEVLPGGAGLHLVAPPSGGTAPNRGALPAPEPLPEVRGRLESAVGATRAR